MNNIKTKFKIFVVDDHAVFREGVVRIINQEMDLVVCGEAADAVEAITQIPKCNPDLALIDISLGGMSGIDLIRDIRNRLPELRLLVLSMFKESLYAERALRAGANGYVAKHESGQTLLTAIRRVLQGQTYISEEMNEIILHRIANTRRTVETSPIESLSDREFEILQLIGRGYGTRQVAEELNISMKTVETHREHLREKLGLKNTFEMVQYAIHWVQENELPKTI